MAALVQSNILDPIHDSLPHDVWDNAGSPEPKLKGQHSRWIRTTVEHALDRAGYTHMQDWLSLVLTGSLTTYQYDAHSDCDISLFVDAEAFPEWSRAEMIGVMVEACDGVILPGTTYQLQGFVVPGDIHKNDLYQPGLRSGWDIDHHRWIEPPDRTRVHDVEKEMNASYAYALEQADKMERLLRYEPQKAVIFWHQIHKRRQRDQKAGKGDYSDSNIVYKFLNNRGLFPAISELSGEYIARSEPQRDSSSRADRISQLRPEDAQGHSSLSRSQSASVPDHGGGTSAPQGTRRNHSVDTHRPSLEQGLAFERASDLPELESASDGFDRSDASAISRPDRSVQTLREPFLHTADSSSGDRREPMPSSRSHRASSPSYTGNKSSSQTLQSGSDEFSRFPQISEVSGEYIAKSSAHHIEVKVMPDDKGITGPTRAPTTRALWYDDDKGVVYLSKPGGVHPDVLNYFHLPFGAGIQALAYPGRVDWLGFGKYIEPEENHAVTEALRPYFESNEHVHPDSEGTFDFEGF